jgi:hypothetical protein
MNNLLFSYTRRLALPPLLARFQILMIGTILSLMLPASAWCNLPDRASSALVSIANPGPGVTFILNVPDGGDDGFACGETAVYTVTSEGFTDLSNIQFSLSWDPTKLALESALPPDGLSNAPYICSELSTSCEVSKGKLSFLWGADDGVNLLTAVNGTPLLTLHFRVIDNSDDIKVLFDSDAGGGLDAQAVGDDLASLDVTLKQKKGMVAAIDVTTEPNDSPTLDVDENSNCDVEFILEAPVSASDDGFLCGDEVAYIVRANGISNLHNIQWSLKWNTMELFLLDIETDLEEAVIISELDNDPAVGKGKMSFLWGADDEAGTPLFMPYGDVLATLHFRVIKNAENIQVLFDNDAGGGLDAQAVRFDDNLTFVPPATLQKKGPSGTADNDPVDLDVDVNENCGVQFVLEVPMPGVNRPDGFRCGDSVNYYVSARGISNIHDLQFSLGWDVNELQLVTSSATDVFGSNAPVVVSELDAAADPAAPGSVTFLYGSDDANATLLTLAYGDTLFMLRFRVIKSVADIHVAFVTDDLPAGATQGSLPDLVGLVPTLTYKSGTAESEDATALSIDTDTPCSVDLTLVVPQAPENRPLGHRCNDELIYRVRANRIVNLHDLQFALNWNPDLLRYLEHGSDAAVFEEAGAQPLVIAPAEMDPANTGRIAFLWGADEAAGLTFEAEEEILYVRFRVLVASSDISVTFDNAETELIAVLNSPDLQQIVVLPTYRLGSSTTEAVQKLPVDINSPCSIDLVLEVPSVTGCLSADDVFEYTVSVGGNFDQLHDVQFSLNWNPDQFELVSYASDIEGVFVMPILDEEDADYPNGQLAFLLGSDDGEPLQISNGDALLTVTFRVRDTWDGEAIEVVFSDEPTPTLAVLFTTDLQEVVVSPRYVLEGDEDPGTDPIGIEFDEAPIAAPVIVEVVPQSGAVRIRWTAPETNLEYEYSVDGGVWQPLVKAFTIDQAIISDLENCVAQTVRLRAVAANGCIGLSSLPSGPFTPNEDHVDLGTEWVVSGSGMAALNWSSVTYGNGKYVAVSTSGASSRIAYSTDGLSWEYAVNAIANEPNQQLNYYVLNGVAFCPTCSTNGRFVAVATGNGSSGLSNRRSLYSDDGVTWFLTSTELSVEPWAGIAYGDGILVATSRLGSWMTSTDGASWTHGSQFMNRRWDAVAYGEQEGQKGFVSLSRRTAPEHQSESNGLMIIKKVGGLWTASVHADPVDVNGTTRRVWESIDFGNGWFVAVADKAANWAMRTNNVFAAPTGWTEIARPDGLPNHRWRDVAYGSGYFVTVHSDADPSGKKVLVSTDDGATWTRVTEANPSRSWTSVGYGAGKFVAVSTGSTAPPFMASGFVYDCDDEPEFARLADQVVSGNSDQFTEEEVTSQTSVATLEVSVRPNPVQTGQCSVIIDIPSPTPVRVRMLSSQGNVVSQYQFNAEVGRYTQVFDVLSRGFYVVEVVTNQGFKTIQVVRLH